MTATASAAIASLAAARDPRGRFQPGRSGNPAGKKPGTLNQATIMKRLMADGDDERIGALILERALKGEWRALRFVFERLEPKPRSRPVQLDFPEDASIGEMSTIVLRAMASGEISPDEALQAARSLEKHGKLCAGDATMRAGRATAERAAAPAPARPAVAPTQPSPMPRTGAGLTGGGTARDALHSASISSRPKPSIRRRSAAAATAALPQVAAMAGGVAATAAGLHSSCNLQP